MRRQRGCDSASDDHECQRRHVVVEELKNRLSSLLEAVDSDDLHPRSSVVARYRQRLCPEGEIVDWIYQQRRSEPS